MIDKKKEDFCVKNCLAGVHNALIRELDEEKKKDITSAKRIGYRRSLGIQKVS